MLVCVESSTMTTDEIPQPYHRWAANEDVDVRAFSLKDRCLVCCVTRSNPMPGISAVWSNAVAAGPCPQRDWRALDPKTDLRPYLVAYLDEPTTPSERAVFDSLHEETP